MESGMNASSTVCMAVALCAAAPAVVVAEPIPTTAFAAGSNVIDVAIAPAGRYFAKITSVEDRHAVAVVDRTVASGGQWKIVLSDEVGKAQLQWCSFATETRLLCGFRGVVKEMGMVYVATRLVAVDADGKNIKVLLQNSDVASGQFQDQVLDWHPGPPDTVLIQADETLLDGLSRMVGAGSGGVIGSTTSEGYPAIFELNVVTGRLHLRMHSREPIRQFISDGHGNPRLASGFATNS
jgi:hypothetical protein